MGVYCHEFLNACSELSFSGNGVAGVISHFGDKRFGDKLSYFGDRHFGDKLSHFGDKRIDREDIKTKTVDPPNNPSAAARKYLARRHASRICMAPGKG
jgi:hypothetical protein